MTKNPEVDAIIIGSGPNGLSAAITLAQAGWSVRVYEARDTVGGGMRTYELTLPGFKHDICSAIHPLGMGSPFYRNLPLDRYGLDWIQPSLPLAHPLDDGSAALLDVSIDETARWLGVDAKTYRRIVTPLANNWDALADMFLGPLRFPRDPIMLAYFGIFAIQPATLMANLFFETERAQALLAGLAAHSIMPLERPPSVAFGLVLGILAHVVGWPLPRGGSQSIADAMAAYLRDLGGEIVLDAPVTDIDELPSARAYLFDLTPQQILSIAHDHLPPGYRKQLARYRYGQGVFKIDYALSAPVPWTADAPRRAGTVHLGGTLNEIAASERAMWRNQHSDSPYVLVAQQSLFDDTRAPDDKHTLWAYCHVPRGSTVDMNAAIDRQIERFAPGFRDTILARHSMNTQDVERYNMNYIGGDINGGVQDFLQLFTRPSLSLTPYRTPAPGIYICSSSTPPGGGVHGMCGYHAAKTVLRDIKP